MAQAKKTGKPAQKPDRAGIEGRTQKRYRCREEQVVRLALKPTFHNFSALVHDLSRNGIGFLLQEPLDIGSVLALQLRGGQKGTSLVRTAKVVHVGRHLPVRSAPWMKKKPLLKVILSFLGGRQAEKEPGQDFIWLIGCRLSPPLTREELASFSGEVGE
jgi:hypothetical protein